MKAGRAQKDSVSGGAKLSSIWLRVSLVRDKENNLKVQKFPFDGSGILSSMVSSDGLVELSEDIVKVSEGDLVDFLPFSEVLN